MSRRRAGLPFKRYSLDASRYTTRSTDTSSKSKLKRRRELSKTSFTAARLPRGAASAPFQIKSSVRLPRILLTDCSPSTKRMDSLTLLFPEPFGPTIAVIGVLNSKIVRFANDLKPDNSNERKCIIENKL